LPIQFNSGGKKTKKKSDKKRKRGELREKKLRNYDVVERKKKWFVIKYTTLLIQRLSDDVHPSRDLDSRREDRTRRKHQPFPKWPAMQGQTFLVSNTTRVAKSSRA